MKKEIMYDERGEPTGIVFISPKAEVSVSATLRTVRVDVRFTQYFKPDQAEGPYGDKLDFSLSFLMPEVPWYLSSREAAEDATLKDVLDDIGSFIEFYRRTIADE